MQFPPFASGAAGSKVFPYASTPDETFASNMLPYPGTRHHACRTQAEESFMPQGTLDIMKLDGHPVTYQIMFEQNPGGTFVARVDGDDLLDFLHIEMRVDLSVAQSAAQRVESEGRTRLPGVFLEENNLHAVMDYLEEDI
jgi:hypothetical protein